MQALIERPRVSQLEAPQQLSPEVSRRPEVVMKFGGFCMSTAENIRKSADIVLQDPRRKAVVVSAAGSRFDGDLKVTDFLEKWVKIKPDTDPTGFRQSNETFRSRHLEIAQELFSNNIDRLDQVSGWLNEVTTGFINKQGDPLLEDWSKSRGEWIMGKMFTSYLEYRNAGKSIDLVDPGEYIKLTKERKIHASTYNKIANREDKTDISVISGYYGSDEDGNVITFPRGGSDITAVLWAAGSGAASVEMFKNVSGVKAVAPSIVPSAPTISHLSTDEMLQMSYKGSEVLAAGAITPFRDLPELDIPILIKKLEDPEGPSTMITRKRERDTTKLVVGIAHKGDKEGEDFLGFRVRQDDMNETPKVAEHVLAYFGRHDAPVDHTPTDMNTFDVIVPRKALNGDVDTVLGELRDGLPEADVTVQEGLGVLCVVGQEIPHRPARVLSRVYGAIDDADIDLVSGIYAPESNNVVVVVKSEQLQDAVRVIYDATINHAPVAA